MFTVLKWFVGFLVSLALLLAVAVVVLPRIIDPNDYRDDIAQLVADKTGRRLALDGELKVSVFPWLGIQTQGLRFSQPENIGGDMLAVEQAQLRVKLIPLLSRRLEVDTIVLESPRLTLVTLADGTDSFAGLMDQANTQAEQSNTDGSAAAVALVVQGMQMTDASLVIEDKQAGSVTDLKALNLTTGNLLGDQLAEISMNGILKGSEGSPDTIFEVNALAKINAQTAEMQAQDLSVSVVMHEQSMSFDIESFSLNQQQIVEINNVSGEVLGITASDEPARMQLKNISANLLDHTASFSPLLLELDSLQARVENLKISDMAELVNTSAKVIIEPFNANELFKDLAIDYLPTDKQALQKIAAKFDLKANMTKASLQNLVVNIDQSTLSGSASIANFEQPKIAFDLNLDQMDLDRYSPQDSESSPQADSQEQAVNPLLVPMALFKDLNANGRFRANKLISGGLEIDQVDVQLASSPGQVTITPSAQLYQGSLDGTIAYSDNSAKPQLEIKNDIDLVALGELLTDAEISEQLEGIGSLALDLLVSETNGVQSNSGTIKLLAKQGVVKGVDIKGIVDQAYTQYQQFKGRPESTSQTEKGESESDDKTEFSELLGTFNLQDSILTNDDFAMSAPLFDLTGAGTIDLVQQSLDYVVRFSFKDSSDAQGSEALDKLKGVVLPIRLSGDLTAPSYSLDMQALIQGLLKYELNAKKGEFLKDKVGIEGGEKLSTKDVLKQLLINKATEKDQDQQGSERPLTDVGSDANARAEDDQDESLSEQTEEKKSDKDQLKDELKKKLLDGLFN